MSSPEKAIYPLLFFRICERNPKYFIIKRGSMKKRYYLIIVSYNPHPVNSDFLDTPEKSLVVPITLQNPLCFFTLVNCNNCIWYTFIFHPLCQLLEGLPATSQWTIKEVQEVYLGPWQRGKTENACQEHRRILHSCEGLTILSEK